VSSNPSNGGQVSIAPSEVVINYSEGVQLGEITVVDSRGERVDLGQLIIGSEDRTVIKIPLQEIGEGIYTLRWQVLAEDGHTTKGAFFFIVGEELPPRDTFLELLKGEERSENVSPYEPPIRSFIFLSLIVLVGSPITLLLVVNPVIRSFGINEKHLRNNMRILLLGSAITLLISASLLATNQMTAIYPLLSFDNIVNFMTNTTLGNVWIFRLILASALIVICARSPSKIWLIASIIVGILAEISVSLSSHSASIIQGIIPTLVDLGHLLGAALWAGGLVVLAIFIPTMLRNQEESLARNITIRMIRRFSPIAIIGLALAGTNGFLLTYWHVPNWDSLFVTLYGTSLSIKLMLVLAAFCFGAFNRLMIPRLLTRSLKRHKAITFVRSVRIELSILIGVFFLAGLLTSAPPSTVALALEEDSGPLILMGQSSDVKMLLQITPLQVGLNVFDVHFSQDDKPIDNVENVRILLSLPEENVQLPQSSLALIEPSVFSTLSSFPLHGNWNVRVSADVDGKFVAETFTVQVPSKESSSDDMKNGYSDVTQEPFKNLLIYGAISLVVVAALMLVYEFYDSRKVKLHANIS
jgi:copper transport protein